jgi:hypothetical protein
MPQERKQIEVSESEIVRMTKDLDDLHHDVSLPALRRAVREWSEEIREALAKGASMRASRRGFLGVASGTIAAGALLAACSSSSSKPKAASPSSSVPANYPANLTGDLAVVALAASLENLGVYAYKAGINAAVAGKLGTVPPAVVTFAKTAMSQHQEHAQAWNSVLASAGLPAVTKTTPKLTPVVNQKFASVTDVTSLAQLALELENIAGQTYQVAVGAVKSQKGVATAATIQPVELQHAAILYFVLGQYPAPNSFNPTDMAAKVADLQPA